MRTWRIVTTALVAVAVAGCVSPGPVAPTGSAQTPTVVPSATTTATVAPVATPRVGATTPATTPFVPRPMPWSDGGPMLWPVYVDAGLQAAEGSRVITHGKYGFLDATGRHAVPANYDSFVYCLGGDRPTRVVAARAGRIDVLALNGSVKRTIKTSGALEGTLFCLDNKTVAVVKWDESGGVFWQEGFVLSTGARVATPMTKARWAACLSGRTESEPPKLPDGYPVDALGGWASNEASTDFINTETRATVTKPSVNLDCYGAAGGFLQCEGGRFPTVFDKHGNSTVFASITNPLVSPNPCDADTARLGDSPYLWATAGQIQGYIDPDGVWHFQMPLHTTLND